MFLLAGIVLASATLLLSGRYGVQRLLLPVLLLAFLLWRLVDPGVAVTPLAGLIAGLQVGRKKGYGQTVAAAALPGALHGLLLLVAQEIPAREELADQLLRQLHGMGVQLPEDADLQRSLATTVVRLNPSVAYLSGLLTVVLGYQVGGIAGRRLQLSVPPALPFRKWRPWASLIWVLIAGLALQLLGGGAVADVALNLVVVMAVLYAIQGLAVVRFFAQRWGIPALVEVLAYLLLALVAGVAPFLLAALGLLDTWFDWRRLDPAQDQAPSAGDRTE
jgi:hypothetical protein